MKKSNEDQQHQENGHATQPKKPWGFYLVVVAILSVTIAFVIIMVLYYRLKIFDQENAANITAALGTLFGFVGTLVGAYFGIKASSEAQGRAEKRVAEAERRVETAPQQAKPAWD